MCIFTSGTLQVNGRFDHYTRAMGLRHVAPESRHIDPVRHGLLQVELAPDELDTAEMAQRILSAERPVLVLTTSHVLSAELGGLCPAAVWRAPAESLADAVARCPADGILIAAGAWSGLDVPRLRWRTVVIPRTPYLRPAVLDGSPISSYLDSEVVAIRRTNQGLHRGLRTPDARCTLLLLDPRSGRDRLRQAIPARFQVAWRLFEEGSVVLRPHLESEHLRNASLRSHILRVRGAACEHPGCGVAEIHKLDVHHLRPIAQGQRQTSVDDVRVLCKNHHAEAHHVMRMAAISDAGSPENPY